MRKPNKPKPPGYVNPCKGKPNGKARPTIGRLWEKTEKRENGCWIFTGAINWDGYGRIWDGKKIRQAHHITMEAAGIELPKWPMVCDHMCRDKACVNPDHIRIVTQGVNTTENSNSWWAKNKAKEACPKGHPYTPENVARTAKKQAKGNVTYGRICLTCYPHYWRHAVIPRPRPPGARRLSKYNEI